MNRASWHRIVATARLELAVQRHDPITYLYPLVLGLLAFAHASGGPVELVPSRGAVPRGAPWTLALASTGLVAIGQVITTMVTATTILRDRAVRIDGLLGTGALRPAEYVAGKLAAAVCVLLLVYAAIPVGFWLGLAIDGGIVHAAGATGAVLRPFLFVVVPVMLAVGMLQFTVGALSGRLWTIVGQGLVLLWLWSATLGAAERGAVGLATWLDPFGSAPVLAATRSWTDAVRATSPLTMDTALLVNRALWLAIGALGIVLAATRASIAAPVESGKPPRSIRRAAESESPSHPPASWRTAAPAPLGVIATMRAQAAHTASWMLRDTGWRVLAALGALNVALNAWRDVPHDASPRIAAAHALHGSVVHARLFLILLATIYAGELVWRARERRIAPLFDVLPVRVGALAAGGLVGTVAAQAVLIALLGAAAWTVAAVAAGVLPGVTSYAAATVLWLLVPFVAWMICSWAVHVVVAHKTAAHLVIIAAWVVAVTIDGRMQGVAWWRMLAWPAIDPVAFAARPDWNGAVGASAAWLALAALAAWLAPWLASRLPPRDAS